ncbi:hypothetical protein E2C01_085940 [Portunus trituberculatus]|uniref:Uncharacterized protein n=1 Tax=Portunus trituberculatus TaxID=210409 RepID=A0A5B7J8D0_PORTR|nr:hypothetical protein [Portunus trituberculatus]
MLGNAMGRLTRTGLAVMSARATGRCVRTVGMTAMPLQVLMGLL